MCQDFYQKYSKAKEVIDEANAVLQNHYQKRSSSPGSKQISFLSDVMFHGPMDLLTETDICQPAILTHSIAVYKILQEKNFQEKQISCVMGHSLGEYSALVIANSLSLKDALELVYHRGAAMKASVSDQRTKMAALLFMNTPLEIMLDEIGKSQKELDEGEVCDVANINSTAQIVLSGTEKGVSQVVGKLKAKKLVKKTFDLSVSAPFHSRLMENASKIVQKKLEEMKVTPPTIPVIFNVTAQTEKDPRIIRQLLVQQTKSPVNWYQSLVYAHHNQHSSQKEIQDKINHFWEIGPGNVLKNIASKQFPLSKTLSLSTTSDLDSLENEILYIKK